MIELREMVEKHSTLITKNIFQYLGQPLDQTDDDWTAMRRNTIRARSVRGRLGTLL